ncbi:MAG: acetyl-CoA carboxylase biotin carboxyl carrier protein subunit [Bacteroidota bacterium]|nr:acetyl-CoA carboxylase biotin carboxyl carrier protein subunit [Bacteroidota bacterium]MDP4205231.1 acetyl-CoA carboxylase biotin carboxyl carrier protein subunit [Bacteroidota bacterium]
MSEEYKTLLIHGAVYKTQWTKKFENRTFWKQPDEKEIHTHIPGTVISINTKVGAKVKAGECILILEAMKMLNRVTMPFDGVIKEILAVKGQKIPKGTLIFVIE